MTCTKTFDSTHLCVYDFMSTQCACLAETFPTHFANKRSGPRVHRHVAREVVVRVKHLREKTTTCTHLSRKKQK